MSDKKLTPLMEQYWSVKNLHEDKIVMFRMGDFFEMFHEDAIIAAPILNIALTQRNKKSNDDTPMCGMPHHSISGPIQKLLSAGHKVVLVDQVEDPKEAKGLVKREVTRILSPGMVFDSETLDQQQANYIAAFDDRYVSFLEASTGEAFYYEYKGELNKIISALKPTEVVLQFGQKAMENIEGIHYSSFSLDEFKDSHLPSSAQLLMAYASYMQGDEILNSLDSFECRSLEQYLEISATVVRHLEVFETYKGEKKGSLFYAINRAKTSAGARLLKRWLQFPLCDLEAILKRQEKVSYWQNNYPALKELRNLLGRMGDIERRLVRISSPGCNPRDLVALKQSLISGLQSEQFYPYESMDEVELQLAHELAEKIDQWIDEESSGLLKNTGFICRGVFADLDELIELSERGQEKIIAMETRERELLGVSSLKIKYNNVFGYYIEVPKTQTSKVPDHYKRKQTLANAERYITQELQELEDKILSAKSKRLELEQQKFNELKKLVLKQSKGLLRLAKRWSTLDVLSSLAWLAVEYNYTCPKLSRERSFIQLKGSRHAVVEQTTSAHFVPNDIAIESGHCLLLTGPNMAGKSTLMRQVALTVMLAQMGSFVPATEAHLGLFEKLFTRIGASDFLSEGLSTFMVEMQETAEMLKMSNSRSLVILDEVGRGTSTYDGMSLAQSILEYLVKKTTAVTLFATHYHEITQLEKMYEQVHNAHMSISEHSKDLQFLYKLKLGPANKSYGIQVAELAGLPKAVTQRAQGLLKNLELKSKSESSSQDQLSLLSLEDPFEKESLEDNTKTLELLDQIRKTSVQSLTPLEALNQIAQWQKHMDS
ncbi:MAG: DNA mismatch repair protein MutS [Bdellovibrionales bacterium]|nr:DNA mismatch repair protein MutS [Bdellovibrionales bacterium]